jgi:hypothetical protein
VDQLVFERVDFFLQLFLDYVSHCEDKLVLRDYKPPAGQEGLWPETRKKILSSCRSGGSCFDV